MLLIDHLINIENRVRSSILRNLRNLCFPRPMAQCRLIERESKSFALARHRANLCRRLSARPIYRFSPLLLIRKLLFPLTISIQSLQSYISDSFSNFTGSSAVWLWFSVKKKILDTFQMESYYDRRHNDSGGD
jgi:hypothetical protein